MFIGDSVTQEGRIIRALNDLEFGPMIYKDRRGRVFMYVYGQPVVTISPLLMRWSRTYQRYAAHRWTKLSQDAMRQDGLKSGTRQAPQKLCRELSGAGIEFKVLLLPVLNPLNLWHSSQVRSRTQALEILDELGVKYRDPMAALGIANVQEGRFLGSFRLLCR